MKLEACDACLARSWLLAHLSGHLDRERVRIWELLELADQELIRAVAGGLRDALLAEHGRFGARQAQAARRGAADAGLQALCACTEAYPAALRELRAPPAVLHVAGGTERLQRFCAADPVAIVGARKAGSYGLDVARSLGRGLSAAGVTVLSGLAAGVDAYAHRGALDGRGATIAVMPGPAQRPYPAANARLHREILRDGVAISELGPGVSVRRWMFASRNRVIAGLARLVVVVQAAPGSGSLLTVEVSRVLGRPVAAVPGPVTSPLSAGPNQLLAEGAVVIRDARDVLDALFGASAGRVALDVRPALTPEQAKLLAAVGDGLATPAALLRAGVAGEGCLAELTRLELSGRLRRGAGGRLAVIP